MARQPDKQRKLVKLLSENLGREKPMTMLEMMLAAGYEESTARQQSTVLVGIREELAPIVRKVEEPRDQVIAGMIRKMPKGKAPDQLTKNIQLLSGKATENLAARVVYLPPRKTDGAVETES